MHREDSALFHINTHTSQIQILQFCLGREMHNIKAQNIRTIRRKLDSPVRENREKLICRPLVLFIHQHGFA